MEFKRVTINDVNTSRFYQMPKFLFESELKTTLSAEAKVLYMLLRDRHELSIANGWINKNNEVFLIFTRNEMCEMLGCGKNKTTKLVNELINSGLMDEERQGLSKPNLIYLNYINIDTYVPKEEKKAVKASIDADSLKSSFKTPENQASGLPKIKLQDSRKLSLNKTNNNNTNYSDTDTINLSADADPTDKIDLIEKKKYYEEIIKENIGYDYFKSFNSYKDQIDNVFDVIVDVLISQKEYYKINQENIPTRLLKEKFLKLTDSHIQYVFDKLENYNKEIKNPFAYLVSSLYNSLYSNELYWNNLYNTTEQQK